MKHDWSLREEILIAAHRWPAILLSGLIGILLAWIISFIFPSQYRATKELYVGINIVPPTGEAALKFTNADDFKNWQMSNLDSAVKLDMVIDSTLQRLQTNDRYWAAVGQEELNQMLHVYWRNAGKWRLVAEHKDPQRARQAVLAWEEVVIEYIDAAIESAQSTMILELELQSITNSVSDLNSQILSKSERLDLLRAWQIDASQWPAQQVIDPIIRAQIQSLIIQEHILGLFPPPQAFAEEYVQFLEIAISAWDQDILSLQNQKTKLEENKNAALSKYTTASSTSLGLSVNLIVDQVSDEPAELSIVRPSGTLILVGGLTGLILWGFYWAAGVVIRPQTGRDD